MAQNINITVPLNDLAIAIAEQLLPLIKDLKLNEPAQKQPQEDYLTRKETADLLNVSLPTLTDYTKRGKIKGHRFGIRVLYKQSDINNALLQIKGGSYD